MFTGWGETKTQAYHTKNPTQNTTTTRHTKQQQQTRTTSLHNQESPNLVSNVLGEKGVTQKSLHSSGQCASPGIRVILSLIDRELEIIQTLLGLENASFSEIWQANNVSKVKILSCHGVNSIASHWSQCSSSSSRCCYSLSPASHHLVAANTRGSGDLSSRIHSPAYSHSAMPVLSSLTMAPFINNIYRKHLCRTVWQALKTSFDSKFSICLDTRAVLWTMFAFFLICLGFGVFWFCFSFQLTGLI